MTNQHPITPPPELMQQWEEDWYHSKVKHVELLPYIAAQSAQYGADQELEACCEWLMVDPVGVVHEAVPALRAARRPKPPSLKEQALDALASLQRLTTDPNIIEPLRRALEALPE